LLVLGEMAKRGTPVAFLDWEWSAERLKARKRRLFGDERLGSLYYLRWRNALTVERDHIRRFCQQQQIQFIGIDSIGAAWDAVSGLYDRGRAELESIGVRVSGSGGKRAWAPAEAPRPVTSSLSIHGMVVVTRTPAFVDIKRSLQTECQHGPSRNVYVSPLNPAAINRPDNRPDEAAILL
jgi:hypothetical protein